MLGTSPLLVAPREAALEESLRNLWVHPCAPPIGFRQRALGLAFGSLKGKEQPRTWVVRVFLLATFTQPALEGVFAHADETGGRASGRAEFTDGRACALNQFIGDGERWGAQAGCSRGILSTTHFQSRRVLRRWLARGLDTARRALARAAVERETVSSGLVSREIGARFELFAARTPPLLLVAGRSALRCHGRRNVRRGTHTQRPVGILVIL
jgi:hypothetical protein